ncbi:MAG: hypothetical protein JNJ80_13270 [Gemmatimonadetes bacterium]|nr:hypothetical protein [Gemmatimonadota bacterium]MCC7132642.1 hypothetical protein [Gemmatimonadales bacterium]
MASPVTGRLTDRERLLRVLSQRGARGGRIEAHRAMLRLPNAGRRLSASLLLGVAGLAGFVALLPTLGAFWGTLFRRIHAALGLPGPVVERPTAFGPVEFTVPTVAFDAPVPMPRDLAIAAGVVAGLIVISLALRGRWLPAAYFLRAVAVVLTTAVGFFAFWPDQFPYRLSEYVVGHLQAGLVVMGLVPLVLGFTFYLFDLSVLRKILLTAMVLGHLAIFLPLQAMFHALVVSQLTLVAMPVLALLFGILLDVMVFVAFYGWAMSWPSALWEEVPRP